VKRFLLISDIHACDVDPGTSKAPSYVSSFRSSSLSRIDPIAELERLIKQHDLMPDCILCPGDITNKSQPDPFGYAWQRLHELASKCGARLIATIGNHDIDSRYKSNAYDPRGFAMSLAPNIPVTGRKEFLEFWAENFTAISFDECNIIALNTAAFHGFGKNASGEIQHGRISDATLGRLQATLGSLPAAPVNILLCHHHLVKPEVTDDEFVGLTRGGNSLVQLLSDADSPWIVVHGHTHRPDLFHAYGGSNAPVILGCASFSAQINEDALNKNPNQVHLLVCDPDGARADGLASCGQVISWTWQPGVGWEAAMGLHGLPHIAGFGYRATIDSLIDQVDQYLSASGAKVARWEAISKIIPGLIRLIPTDFERLRKSLNKRGLELLSEGARVRQIGRVS
jgi:3',5'-cyclic AMP phosphodiesterase CpdA